MKFRKKPVVIDAIQWLGDFPAISEFVGDSEDVIFINQDGTLDIPTREGRMTGSLNDWLIRGIAGEFYQCKPDIFAATYEPVLPDAHSKSGGTPE